ncbi:OsmC family protein [Sulfobacillus thermosulfidooxidans]|uniref:OsmC family protein n=1 Tax=Sulfobacillus thermosulfidooxidans TaxID=28034 RepID=UPI0009E8E25A|nr:OsmC family protein [Sulfobacillus thermosulfidooxidans]
MNVAHVDVKYTGDMQFVATAPTGHSVVIDSSPEVGGKNSGVRPMDLTLMALGGCTGIDVVSILKKMRVNLDSFTMDIDGERASDHPKVYTKIFLNYRFSTPDDAQDKISRAVHLSQEKYCSVSQMLVKSAVIEARIFINGELVETLSHS